MGEDLIDEYGVNIGSYFIRNIYVNHYDQNDFIKKFKSKYHNTDVFKRIYSSEKEDTEEGTIYGPMYLDFDNDKISDEHEFMKVRADVNMVLCALEDDWRIPSEMIRLYFSGSKGFHIMIDPIVFGAKPKDDLNMDYKVIAMELNNQCCYKTIDTRIYDKRRLFRIENSINSKCNLYKIPLYPSELMDYSYEELKEMAKTPRMIRVKNPEEVRIATMIYKSRIRKISQYNIIKTAEKAAKKNTTSTKKYKGPKEILPCIISGIEEGAPIGSRNNILVALASALFQYGQNEDQVLELMLQWNESNEESLNEKEIHTTVISAERMFETGKKYGCDTFKSLGLCVGTDCKLYQRKAD